MKFLVKCLRLVEDETGDYVEVLYNGAFYADGQDEAIAQAEEKWADRLDEYSSLDMDWELEAEEVYD